jgi:hypothetical protein
MKSNRKGETDKIPLRSTRVFQMKNLWYFNTREGVDIGPFHSSEDTTTNLQDFLHFIRLADKNTLGAFSSALRKNKIK